LNTDVHNKYSIVYKQVRVQASTDLAIARIQVQVQVYGQVQVL